ncbi:hypothetical protein EES43_22875 [Streptomyces sp. ADI96-02]|uniref:winged helix DNA-binding domain-containing protein n=1 Tax=Streptomyces sp. ADI96-02 TaxID=1522760 RepID=UPI000F54C98B|nr:winged helix DNA-binding domain-containing protein [Streptomyces sp. ADI96-02]RPK56943.1 hypothetical protein EES43_22875 [Streptomyces sp. ADI96-02]
MPESQAPVPRFTWAQVSSRRLARSGLSRPLDGAGPQDVVSALCGAHAQVLSAGEQSVAMRIPGATRATVRDALWTERTVVKSRGARGTVHLLAARDLPMWTGALSSMPDTRNMHRGDGMLTREQTEQVIEGLRVVLTDAEMTADELTDALAGHVGSWAGDRVMEAFQGMWPRWFEAMDLATNQGVLCFGPQRGRKATYTSPARWLPGFTPAPAEVAVPWLVTSYLHAYGPATPQHLARWLAMPRRWAADTFAALGDALQEVDLEGTRCWVVAGDTDMPESEPPEGVRLLPYFDAYGVAGHPRELLFPGRAFERALAGGQAGNYPVLLIDGLAAGVWHQRRSGRRIHITVEPLSPLTDRQRRLLEDEVERVGVIMEGKPELTVGTVSVGPHA